VRSEEALPEGAAVVVDRVEGLTLHVRGVRSLQQNEKAVDHHSLS
jgi:hypothetical protein